MSEISVGRHRIASESSAIAAIHFTSSPDEQEMDEIMVRLIGMQGDRRTCVLIDFTNVQTLSPEVRRVIGARSKDMNVVAIAMYGASFHLRVVAKLVNGAIALFKKNPVPQDFFADRASALEWLRARAPEADHE